jgi:hypothetical protein
MNQTNQGKVGLYLMFAAVLELLLFCIGVMRRSYLALALPVMAAMSAVAALTFWVGWTMLTMDEDEGVPAEAE